MFPGKTILLHWNCCFQALDRFGTVENNSWYGPIEDGIEPVEINQTEDNMTLRLFVLPN